MNDELKLQTGSRSTKSLCFGRMGQTTVVRIESGVRDRPTDPFGSDV